MPAPAILVTLLLASSPAEASSSSTAAPEAVVAVRPPHELRKAIHAALQQSAPGNDPDPYAAAPRLIGLFEELRRDTQIEEFDRKRFSGLLRTRLQSLAKDLENDLATPVNRRPQTVQPRGDVLAQQGLPAAAARPRARTGAGGNPGGGLRDNGQELVDLIKRTIAPSTWDDVGGRGSIYYYRPLRALVIRQTGDVHHQIGGALGGLRRP